MCVHACTQSKNPFRRGRRRGKRKKRKGARVEEDEVGSQSLKSRLSNRVLIFCEFRVVGKFLESSGLILSEIFLILKDSRKEGYDAVES